MRVTKEKIVCALSGLVVLVSALGLSVPQIEPVPPVPAPEPPRAYRTVAATVRLAPDKTLGEDGRDPFRPEDPWAPAEPAIIVLPPQIEWPRAIPGGVAPVPQQPSDRIQLFPDEVPR